MNINWRRVGFWVVVLLFVVWVAKNPTAAGSTGSAAWHKVQQVGDGAITFVDSLLKGVLS